MSDERRQLAVNLFQRAYMLQMEGELDRAAQLYRESIDVCPTAEAYTFLGWTYRFQGRDFRLTDVAGKVVKRILS